MNTGSSPSLEGEKSYLDFATFNKSAPETIILIHGAGATGLDWNLTQPYLDKYHLLVPSLFTHGSLALVRQTKPDKDDPNYHAKGPRWQQRFVKLLADLILGHAKDSKAHVVGLSLGGTFALALVANHANLSRSLFVSGLPKLISRPPTPVLTIAKVAILTLNRILESLGPEMLGRFLDSEVKIHGGSWDGKGGKTSYELAEILVDTVAGGHPSPVMLNDGIKNSQVTSHDEEPDFCIRIVAATRKSRWTPFADSTEFAVEAAKQLCGAGQVQSISFEGRDARHNRMDVEVFDAKAMFHPWSRQDPELFARCILATVEGNDFPTENFCQIWKSRR